MAEQLRRHGRQPMFAEILFPCQSFVMSNSSRRFGLNQSISSNGYHVGIFVSETGLVHCNVHPQGLTLAAWFNDFFTAASLYRGDVPLTHVGPFPVLGAGCFD